jgi:flagellar basal-body rod modification protein FlgD
MSTAITMPVSDPLAALSQATQPKAQANASDPGEDRFLKLLITQLKNQDPLSPLDNAQLTSQLAQISTVQGIEKLNASLATLASGFTAGQSVQAANLVGRQVLVTGDLLELGGAGASGAFALPQAADALTVTVTDASGTVVHRVDLGAQPAGTQVFAWDGQADTGVRLADGHYRFGITASANGKPVEAQALSVGRVDGVSTGAAGGATLDLGILGSKTLADIKRIM